MEPDQPRNESVEEAEARTGGPSTAEAGARRSIWRPLALLAAALVLAGAATAGYLVVLARASGSCTSLPLARVSGAPTSPPGSSPAPQAPQWTVVRAQGRPVKVFTGPSSSAKLLMTVPASYRYGVDSVMLVRGEQTVAGQTWYDVLLPVPPIYSQGWVKASSVGMYFVNSMIKIDLSARRLSVIRDGKVIGEFPVAVGNPQKHWATPAGTFFVAQKVRAVNPNTVYGPVALGLSAFAPALASEFPPDGQVAIHGWTDQSVIGQAVSHGCIRMKIADMLWVASHVSTGSPVLIQQ